MAQFFSTGFMNRRRAQWLRSIHEVKVRSSGTWYTGEIQKKEVSGDTLIINVVFSDLDARSCYVDRSQITDTYGEVIHEQSENIQKATGQGTMLQIKVPIRETT